MTTEEALNEVKGTELGNGNGPTQQPKKCLLFKQNKMEQGCTTTTERGGGGELCELPSLTSA